MADGGVMWTNWSQPALGDVVSGSLGAIPKSDNIFPVRALNASTAARYKNASSETDWAVLVLEELTPIPGISHPMHLHGHDFLVLATGIGKWDGTTDAWQLTNPQRRDTASMPPNGHIVIAWALDNPGLWLLHCHIPWHSSQGFSATILESPALISGSGPTSDWEKDFVPVCEKWNDWYPDSPFKQDDSGV